MIHEVLVSLISEGVYGLVFVTGMVAYSAWRRRAARRAPTKPPVLQNLVCARCGDLTRWEVITSLEAPSRG